MEGSCSEDKGCLEMENTQKNPKVTILLSFKIWNCNIFTLQWYTLCGIKFIQSSWNWKKKNACQNQAVNMAAFTC